MFGDVLDVIVDPIWRRRLGCDRGIPVLSPAELLRLRLPRTPVSTECKCFAHRGVTHRLVPTDVHVAGTTCTDHSLLGTLNRDDGKNAKCDFVWVAIMRELRPPVIVHENVVGFGFSGLQADLGDLYVICPSRFCASDFGFPIRRPRQMCVLVLRDWVVAGLRAAGHSDKCSDSSLRRLVDLEATLRSCCVRTHALHWRHFLVATDADQEEERARNAARPSVVARMQLIAAGATHTTSKGGEVVSLFPDDVPGGCLASLLPTERRRLSELLSMPHRIADVADVQHNPTKRDRSQSG